MPKSLQALRDQRAEKVTAMRQLLDAAAEDGDRDLTADEAKQYDDLKAEAENLGKQIERAQSLEEMEASLDEPEPSKVATTRAGGGRAAGDFGERKKQEFESVAEFLATVRFNQSDERLAGLYGEVQGAAQNTGEGAAGGFMVPEQFMPELLSVDQQQAIVRPRARVIGSDASQPDAGLTIPALDQSDSANMYGGVEVYPTEEGGNKQDTDAQLRDVKLNPNEIAAIIPATDKLLRNWRGAQQFLTGLLRGAIVGWEDDKFMTGHGAGIPLGVQKSNAAIQVTRQSANEISYLDVINMDDELVTGAMPVWVITKKAKKQLRQMQDPNGSYIWQEAARAGEPPTLLGYPVLESVRVPTLGNTGDLSLVDLSYYIIKDGAGIFVDASRHAKFRENKTLLKAFFNTDGQPWLHKPITNEDKQQYSPFVLLKKK